MRSVLQLCLFASLRDQHIYHPRNSVTTFRHMFLRDWTDDGDTDAYPSSAATPTAFTRQDFFQFLDFAVKNVSFTLT